MGPTKSSWSVNKPLCEVIGEWPDKVVANASKNKVKKRKLSEVLDNRWTKEELKQFYVAFRKYGKNWKKVGGLLRNRSINMLETLYNLNRAYLSLPEGDATADGFLAKMTDQYNNLEGNDNVCERKGASVKILKHLKCSRAKGGQDILKGSGEHHLQNQSTRSSYKCMSKKYLEGLFTDGWPHAVGKRTPRVPVIHNKGDGDNSVSNNKNVIKPAPDEDTYTATLTLIEASQGGGSLFVSLSPRRRELSRSPNEKNAEADMATSSDNCLGLDNNCLEGYSGRGEVDNDLFGGDTRILVGVNQSRAQCKDRILHEMSEKGTKNCQFSDLGESISHKGKGIKARKFKNKSDKEISEQQAVLSSRSLREKSPILLSEDSALDPLHMLADVSFGIGLQAFDETEPALHGVKQKGENDFPSHPSEPGALSTTPENDKSKISVQGDGGNSSFDVHRSNLPGPVQATCESVNSGSSGCRNKEYSLTARYKSKVHEPLSADPESDNSKILVQRVWGCPSIVRFSDVPEKDDKLMKSKSPGKVRIQKAVPEAEGVKCPYISTKKYRFPSDEQIPEVEIHDDSHMDEHEKNKIHGYSGDPNGTGDEFCKVFSSEKPDGCLKDWDARHPTKFANPPNELHDTVVPSQSLHEDLTFLNPSSKISCIMPIKQAMGDTIDYIIEDEGVANEEVAAAQNTTCNQPCMMESIQSRESEIKAIANLRNAVIKKEGVLKELRQVNDVRTSGALAEDSKQHSDRVAKLLYEASKDVASAINKRRQINTDSESSIPPWFRSSKNSADNGGPSDRCTDEYLINQDSGPYIGEIVMNSRQKARSMVDAAVLAMSSAKDGHDACKRISEALDSSDYQPNGAHLNKLVTGYSCSYPLVYQNQAMPITPKPGTCLSSENEPEIPSGLISDCIATILMIQTISERRYPPADVTRILEDAVESLHPRCPQNLSVYRDIERCMGYIKTQMLALVETPNTSLPAKISV